MATIDVYCLEQDESFVEHIKILENQFLQKNSLDVVPTYLNLAMVFANS